MVYYIICFETINLYRIYWDIELLIACILCLILIHCSMLLINTILHKIKSLASVQINFTK